MSIPIPSLPTDNLYKFLALSGLFLALFSLFITNSSLEKLEPLVGVATVESAILDDMKKASDFRKTEISKEIDAIQNEITAFENKSIKSTASTSKDSAFESNDLTNLRNQRTKLSADLNTIRERNEDIKVELDKYSEEYFSAMEREQKLRKSVASIPTDALLTSARLGIGGFWIGISTMLLGFLFWFTRSQIHQDEILRLNKSKAEIELEKSKFELLQSKSRNDLRSNEISTHISSQTN